MKPINDILLISCLRATELIEKKFHLKLSFGDRLRLSVHKIMCSACSNYEKQSSIIDKLIAVETGKQPAAQTITSIKESIMRNLDSLKSPENKRDDDKEQEPVLP